MEPSQDGVGVLFLATSAIWLVFAVVRSTPGIVDRIGILVIGVLGFFAIKDDHGPKLRQAAQAATEQTKVQIDRDLEMACISRPSGT